MLSNATEMANQVERDEARYRRLLNNHKPLIINRDVAQEKPLFGRATTSTDSRETRKFGSGPKEEVGSADVMTSRIPRRSSYSPDVASSPARRGAPSLSGAYDKAVQEEETKSTRISDLGSRPLGNGGASRPSLAGAYHKAVREETEEVSALPDGLGSPSPAPRPQIRSVASDERRMAAIRRNLGRPATGQPQVPTEAADGDLTTGSEGSLAESLGSLTGLDDLEVERKMAQYAKDIARRDNILDSHPLFSRHDSERRKAPSRKESNGSLEDEPVVVKPGSAWGTKAKLGTTWMRKIISPESSGELVEKPPDQIVESLVDWAGAAADIPLATVEDESSTQQSTPRHFQPSSAQVSNTSPQKSQIWDAELDFTAKSLAAYGTSPALNIRSSKIGEVAAREIESLSKRAVATSRLEEIRERNSASPELNRSPSKEFSMRDDPGQTSSRQGSITSLGKKTSEISLQKKESHSSLRVEASIVSPEPVISETDNSVKEETAPVSDNKSRIALARDAVSKTTNSAQGLEGFKNSSADRLGVDTKSKEANTVRISSDGITPDSSCPETVQDPTTVPVTSVDLEEQYHEKTVLEEEGEHIAGTPITVFYGALKDRPEEKRSVSGDIFRRLAKALSPNQGATTGESSSDSVAKSGNSKLRDPVALDIKRSSTASTPPKSDVDPEERIAAEASLFDLPENTKSERNSLREPSPDDYSDVDETPVPKRNPLSMPTPVVTGAYVDTPQTFRQSRKLLEVSSSDEEDEKKDRTARAASNLAFKDFIRGEKKILPTEKPATSPPPAVKSSLEPVVEKPRAKSSSRFRPQLKNSANPHSAIEDLHRIQKEAQVEDSTLDNLNDLISASDDSGLDSPTLSEAMRDLENDARGRPLSSPERERRREALAYERLNKGLKNGLLSIRDAKRGIERLEDRVSSSPDPATLVPAGQIQTVYIDPYTGQPVIYGPNSPVYIVIRVPRLWTPDRKRRTGIRLTWLGLLTAMIMVPFWTWFIAETIACEMYCRPSLTWTATREWRHYDLFFGDSLPVIINLHTDGAMSKALNMTGFTSSAEHFNELTRHWKHRLLPPVKWMSQKEKREAAIRKAMEPIEKWSMSEDEDV